MQTLNPSSSLLGYKLWYLFFYAAQYTQLFVPLLLSTSFKIPPSQIGLLQSLRRLTISLAAPIFTRLVDYTYLHRPLLLATHTLYYCCSLALTRARGLPLVTLILGLREIFIAGCEPTIDNATVAKLELVNRSPAEYGKLRLYGSVGWGVASVLGSLLVDRVFHGDLLVVLYIQVVLGLVVIALVARGMDLSSELFRRQELRKQQSGAALSMVMRSPRALYCAIAVTMQGVVLGALQMLTFIYFAGLGVSTSALGFSVFLSCFNEAVVFFGCKQLWALCGGAQGALNVGMLLSSVALVLYSVVHYASNVTPWFVVAETMNGGTYAMFLTAAVGIVNELAPPHLATSAQGVLAALGNGMGPCIGAAVAGALYDRVGAPKIFLWLAGVQMVVLGVGIILGNRHETRDEASKCTGGGVLGVIAVGEDVPLLEERK